MAPDEGVLGRSGHAPPLFSRAIRWAIRMAIQYRHAEFCFALRMAAHGETYGDGIEIAVSPTNNPFCYSRVRRNLPLQRRAYALGQCLPYNPDRQKLKILSPYRPVQGDIGFARL